jgi:hypothetical protein
MTLTIRRFVLPLALFTVGATAPAAAQVANAHPGAMGMGDNFTAVARGYSAVAWNPAALGMTGGPQASASIGALRVLGGMGPVTLKDLRDNQGETVPLDVRERWLADIRQEGRQAGAAGFDFSVAAFQTGRFAAQVSTTGRTLTDITPGVAEVILIGNADEQGNLRNIELGGAVVDANVYSTAALSFGMPFVLQDGAARIAFGITGKFTIGHVLGVTEESSGAATEDPARMTFRFPLAYTPVVHTGDRYWIRAGGGFGFDVGVALEMGALDVAAVVQNVFNNFAWNPDRLRYRPLEMVFESGSVDTAVEWEPVTAAPAELRERVDNATFNPSVSLGAAYTVMPQLLVSADARFGSTDGMMTRPPQHFGAGVAFSPLHWLPLQIGIARVSLGENRSGMQFSGGLGLQLGTFLISGSAARRDVGLGTERIYMVNLLSHTF